MIDKSNEDFNSVYEWLMNSNYLDLGNQKNEIMLTIINKKVLQKFEMNITIYLC